MIGTNKAREKYWSLGTPVPELEGPKAELLLVLVAIPELQLNFDQRQVNSL